MYGPYVKALQKELLQAAMSGCHSPLQSIFIGGGTPSILPCSLLAEILDHCRLLFAVAPEVEISLESNPGTVNESSLQALFRAGVNRLSLGVQSFDDRDLISLGRVHTAEEAIAAVRAARNAGFTNLNLDLMCGLPGQTARTWRKTLDQALSLRPEHLSVYQLTIEPETPFGDLVFRGQLELPAEDEILAIDRQTDQACRAAGMQQYEISNYSQPGFECRHNVNYWLNGEYLACGASAVSFRAGVREKRTAHASDYIRRMETGLPVVEERESLSAEASFRETVIMGLRMIRGVSLDTLFQRYGLDPARYYGATLERLLALGMIERTDTHIRLTEAGRPLANQVMAELV